MHESFYAFIQELSPEFKVDINLQIIAEDNKVVTRGTFSGTHQGELMGIPPTGKQVKFSFVHIDTISDGKVTEHWSQADVFGMMQQLGVSTDI
jgi:predicted ester cyclase